MAPEPQKRLPSVGPAFKAGVCARLAAMVFAVFGQTAGFGFINRDDADYVHGSPVIPRGLP